LLVITAAALPGCGTQSTAPESTRPLNGTPGELIIPEPGGGKLTVPEDFQVLAAGGCLVMLTWTAPENVCDAVVHLDGVPLARTEACHEFYLDAGPKTAGDHVYELCYSIGVKLGPVVRQTVTLGIMPTGGEGDRVDPLPEANH
jgi:hypothetical protein